LGHWGNCPISANLPIPQRKSHSDRLRPILATARTHGWCLDISVQSEPAAPTIVDEIRAFAEIIGIATHFPVKNEHRMPVVSDL
jgi:hypothetical protein